MMLFVLILILIHVLQFLKYPCHDGQGIFVVVYFEFFQ